MQLLRSLCRGWPNCEQSGLQLTEVTSYMLCEISSSHGGDYDVQNCLLGCTYFTRQYIPEDNSEQLYAYLFGLVPCTLNH
jgi:hypothetical protein